MPWYADLELERHGAHYIEPELNVALLTSDGGALGWWTDIERTAQSFAQFSRRDAETLRRWHDEFVPIVQNILAPEGQGRRRCRRTSAGGCSSAARPGGACSKSARCRRSNSCSRNSSIRRCGRACCFSTGLREVDLRVRGFGHHIAALLASPAKAQMSRGGTAALARALEAAVRESGGDIPRDDRAEADRRRRRPRRSASRRATARSSGRGISSSRRSIRIRPFSICSTTRWCRARSATSVERFQYNLLAPLFALHLNLREPPRYAASAKHPELAQAFMVIMGLDHFDQFGDIVAPSRGRHDPADGDVGRVPDAVRSEPGAGRQAHRHSCGRSCPIGCTATRNWDAAAASSTAARCSSSGASMRPISPTPSSIQFTRTPLDTERSLPNMREGDLLVGAFTNGQIGYHRPFPGAGSYRAHLPGLYLCGSSSHPGGNITGLPGYNAAQVILADLGIKADWMPPPIAERLSALSGS